MNIREMEIKARIDKGSELFNQKPVEIPPDAPYQSSWKEGELQHIGIGKIADCAALLWYERNEPVEQDPLTPKKRRIFTAGNVHESLTKIYLRLGGAIITGEEVPYKGVNNILSGKTDVEATVSFGEFVGEIKSLNQEHFKNFKVNGVKKSHFVYFTQLQMYMKYTGKPGFLIGYSKNDSEYKVEEVPYEERVASFMESKTINIAYATDVSQIHPDYIVIDDKCVFCDYYEKCQFVKGKK